MHPHAPGSLSCALFLTALCVCLGHQASVTTGPPSTPHAHPAGDNVADDGTGEAAARFNVSSCVLTTGAGVNDSIYLRPLTGSRGSSGYSASFFVPVNKEVVPWLYDYNPCTPISLPSSDPHANYLFGDGCLNVAMCKYTQLTAQGAYYFTLGVQSQEKIEVEQIKPRNTTPIFTLVYTGIKSLRSFKSRVRLICDPERQRPDEALFEIVSSDGLNSLVAELHHRCCCVGACLPNEKDQDKGDLLPPTSGASYELILVIVGTLVGLLLVAVIGGLCFFKKTRQHFYLKLPDAVFNIKFAPCGSHDKD